MVEDPRRRDDDKSDDAMTDRQIEAAVSDLLGRDPDLDTREVTVTVRDGVASIEGSIGGRIARERVEELADAVKGVVAVENNLRVRPSWARSFEDEPDAADAMAGEPGSEHMAVSDISGSELGTGSSSDNRPGVGLGGVDREPTDLPSEERPGDGGGTRRR
jgi:hypothetical protein